MGKKIGRPRVDTEDYRGRRLVVYVNEREHQALIALAHKLGYDKRGLTTMIREAALYKARRAGIKVSK